MFTTIAHYIDPIEAHLARGRLLSEGIDAHLGDEHLAAANWEWRLAVGGVKLRVADGDVDRARSVLQSLDAGEYALESESGHADNGALHAPDRESWSSRLAWVGLMLFGIPLPWRRRATPDDEVVREL